MAASLMAKVKCNGLLNLRHIITSQMVAKHTASVIFLHGSGDTGEGVRDWVHHALGAEFTFPHIRVIYPTAPVRSYTPMNGMQSTVWFDRLKISPYCEEDIERIDEMCAYLDELIAAEGRLGIPEERIIVGGLSMGGALALHYGYRFATRLAGVFALSTFLNEKSSVYAELKEHDGPLPPLYQVHGALDPLVEPQWGGRTHKLLKQLGVVGQYHVYPNLYHELCHAEIEGLANWILTRLPDIKTDGN